MQPSEHIPSTIAPVMLPAPAVSIADGVATITLEPFSAEMSNQTKADIQAADRIRTFIDARADAVSPPRDKPVGPADYPQETLRFLISTANLLCIMMTDRSQCAPAGEVEAIHAAFDSREMEDARSAVRLYTDSPQGWQDFIQEHRPLGPYCLASPIYETEPTAG